MKMFDPPHPGSTLREDYLEELGLSVTAAAKHLGVTRQALDAVVNERSGISSEMAIRLEKAFGRSADMWIRLQADYDLAEARKSADKIVVAEFRAKPDDTDPEPTALAR